MSALRYGRTLITAESGTDRLSAFKIRSDGGLSNRRTFANLPPNSGPDGICLDRHGGVWVSCWAAGNVVRVVEGGAITHIVPMRTGRQAYACMLGGADRTTLMICTVQTSEPKAALHEPSADIQAISVGLQGYGRP